VSQYSGFKVKTKSEDEMKIYEEVNMSSMTINWEKCFLCGDDGDHNCHIRGYGADCEAYCESTNKRIYLNVDFEKYVNIWPEIAGYISNNVASGTRIAEYSKRPLEPNEMLIPDIIFKIPKKMDQLYTLLKYLEGKLKNVFSMEFVNIPPYLVYCNDEYEVDGHIETLMDMGYVRGDGHVCCLTPKGLEKLEELRKSNKNSNRVFIAMKFKSTYSESIRSAVKLGCTQMGLIAESVDEEDYIGDINDRIISEINKSRFVVADYTENNYGVYYESGYARGRGVVVIEICNEMWLDGIDDKGIKNKLHFDVEHRNMIMWKNEEDLSSKIRDRIGSLL